MNLLLASNWAELRSWVQVAGPSVAALLAAVTYARNAREGRRHNAARVWMIADEYKVHVPSGGPAEHTLKLSIDNAGDEPIFDVQVEIYPRDWRDLEPEMLKKVSGVWFATIPPKSTSKPIDILWNEAGTSFGAGITVPHRLNFRDGQGRGWQRTLDGHLKANRKHPTNAT